MPLPETNGAIRPESYNIFRNKVSDQWIRIVFSMNSFSMSDRQSIWWQLKSSLSIKYALLMACVTFVIYSFIVYAYNAFYHPLAKYPGPKLASVSESWSVYFQCVDRHFEYIVARISTESRRATGRWPWKIEATLAEYGDVVRVGPNSLVFLEPQAVLDIHGLKKNLEDTFIKTPITDGLGDKDDGLLWERDPRKHRDVSKMMSPTFSGRSLRAKIPTMDKHIDFLIDTLKSMSTDRSEIELNTWLARLCMDTAADLACNWEMHQVRDMKNHGFLDAMDAANRLVVIIGTAKTYPVLFPLALLCVPWRTMRSLPRMIKDMRRQILKRISACKSSMHSDYFEQILSLKNLASGTGREFHHSLTITGQLILGGYEPTSVTIYMFFHFILQNREACDSLRFEIRSAFSKYEDIESETLRTLPYLDACLQESLRMSAAATHHSVPRISPGGMVCGEYVPKGVICRTSLFAYGRNARFFHDPKSFRPARWVSQDHPAYNPVYAADDHSAHFPFLLGTRQCPGREVARIMFRLVVAKMFWTFDIEQVSEKLDFDRDFWAYGMWHKPEICVRLSPIQRD